jgi:hypothetical protein
MNEFADEKAKNDVSKTSEDNEKMEKKIKKMIFKMEFEESVKKFQMILEKKEGVKEKPPIIIEKPVVKNNLSGFIRGLKCNVSD